MDNYGRNMNVWLKDNGATIILFAQGNVYCTYYVVSNEKLWRYNLIWKKAVVHWVFLNAKKMPLRNHEDICVLFIKKLPTYNPQMTKG